MEGADIITFEILKDDNGRGYAKDKINVYYRGKFVENADVNTIEIFSPKTGVHTYHARDKSHVYEYGEIIQ